MMIPEPMPLTRFWDCAVDDDWPVGEALVLRSLWMLTTAPLTFSTTSTTGVRRGSVAGAVAAITASINPDRIQTARCRCNRMLGFSSPSVRPPTATACRWPPPFPGLRHRPKMDKGAQFFLAGKNWKTGNSMPIEYTDRDGYDDAE